MSDAVTDTMEAREEPRTGIAAIAGSVLLHALIALFLFKQIGDSFTAPMAIPVDLVTIAPETSPPAAGAAGQQRQAALQQQAPRPPSRREQANPNPVSRVSPSRTQEPTNDVPTPPKDELQTKLDTLAQLKQPEADPRLFDGLEAAGRGASGRGRGAGGYNVKDFIRAQVERRWSLDLDALEGRNLTVSIHVMLKRDGSVAKAEIVGPGYGEDKIYRSLAISARNAVILSSPFNLPRGSYDLVKDMVLDLNPRDTMR
jgi:hypothetical protein